MDRKWWQSAYTRSQVRSQFSWPPLVWVVLIGSFFGRGTYYMVWPFLAILLHQKFSLDPAEIGTVLGASAMGAAVLGFYMGSLSDRYGRRSILLTGTAINALSFFLLAYADTLLEIIVPIVLSSIGRSIWEPTAGALFGDLIPDRSRRALALQFRYFLVNAGAALGPIVGIWLGLSAQQSTFTLTALSYVFLWVGFLWAFSHTASGVSLRLKRQAEHRFRDTLRVLKQDQVFLIIILANVLTLFIYAHMDTSLVQYLTLAGAPKLVELISAMILVNAGTIVFLQFPLLRILRRFSTAERIKIGLLVLAAGQVGFAVSPVEGYWSWLWVTFVVSLAEAVLFPTMSVQVDEMAPDHLRGSYFGASSFYSLGWSSAPFIGGIVLQWWSGAVLYWGTFLLCGVALMLYRLSKTANRPSWELVNQNTATAKEV
ncbi:MULTISPECIES: MDR family MFS transporter [Microbulbifer]|uniref:MDR family MFS transporter n=1 Tax=Microbulbifer celer TaxID=435905 RepID=A0ABW3UFH2_9GAMM|nr:MULTISPECIES: MFS transporter [Microbulbifer]UFN55779.1 MFS transporter [Microbulbifer celer]